MPPNISPSASHFSLKHHENTPKKLAFTYAGFKMPSGGAMLGL
jgi:hypothetical protein